MSVTKTGVAAALLMMVGIGSAAGQDFTLACLFPQPPQVSIDASKPCVGAVTITLAMARNPLAELQITGTLNAGLEPLACIRPLQGSLFATAADIRADIVRTSTNLRRIHLRSAQRTSEQYWIEVLRPSRRTKQLLGVTYTEFDAILTAGLASQLHAVAGVDRLAGQCSLRKIQ